MGEGVCVSAEGKGRANGAVEPALRDRPLRERARQPECVALGCPGSSSDERSCAYFPAERPLSFFGLLFHDTGASKLRQHFVIFNFANSKESAFKMWARGDPAAALTSVTT